jgi:hypothetical protein
MRIHTAMSLSVLLFAGLVTAYQPVSIACGPPFSASQRVVAVHAAVLRFAETARAVISVRPAGTKGGAVGAPDGHAPAPNFAVPGPGWG